jgi:peptide/nickel transport system substrate-binding protein
MNIRRREFLALAAASGAAAMSMPVFGQQQQVARRETLRLVPSTDLVYLDPVFSTALVSVQHGYHVFDTLFGVDGQLNPHPQMAEGHQVSEDGLTWTISLRDGLLFHDGEPVRATDCVASLERWSQIDNVGRTVADVVDTYEVVDDKSFKIHLTRPYLRLLNALGKPHSSPAFIMPERLAATSPSEQVTEMIGSGPYRFLADEWNAGSFVAYSRFEDYVPRSEPAEWTSGGKVAKFERVEWHVIRDQSTAVAALQRGEVDWMEALSADLVPLIEADPNLTATHDDPLGRTLFMRFNHKQAPFNNKALRQFVMKVINQADYYAALTGGDPDKGRDCFAMLPCSLETTKELGEGIFEALNGSDADTLAQELAATGYNGEKIVIINAADSLVVAPLGRITADVLARAGLNIELQEMDWGTMLQRNRSQEAVDNGGWSILHTAWPTVAIPDPAQNVMIRGNGDEGYPGWYESAEMEELITRWSEATTPEEQQDIGDQINLLAIEDVPSLPLGLFLPNMAYRSELEGVLHGSVRYPWNVERVES